jgi:NADPH-dependent 2,4-dienoyl-CoA reductase/sulfur reductase-like enzyme
VFAAVEGDDALIVRPRVAVIATGAYERPRMVPGWDLPGVMTTGAAQIFWRSYRTLPGARVIVAGSGPLNVQVALELAQGGARLVAVCEAAPSPLGRLGTATRMIVADPAVSAKGAWMLAGLIARGVRVRYGTVLERIEPSGDALVVTLAGPKGSETAMADAVLMNDGFQPANEILRLLGCAMEWDARFAQLRPIRSGDCETSVAGIHAVGDCCGLGGAAAAAAEGTIAGMAAARRLGLDAGESRDARAALTRARAFQDALWHLYAHPPQDLAAMPAETLFCRCEEVTKGELDAVLDADPGDIGAVKRATRIGMGRCQGRYCGPALVRLLAARKGEAVEDRSFFAPRAPIKPVRIAAILAAEAAIDALGPKD